MKVALCFLISYDHKLKKEKLWIDWIEKNKKLINVYFHYKDKSKIESEWILNHCLPEDSIVETSYYHVVGAYVALLKYAINHDVYNKWFIFLTDSCVPIIQPVKFRDLFYEYSNYSILRWKQAWWDINHHKRANLRYFPARFQLGHDPWFILNRYDVQYILNYFYTNPRECNLICSGGLANESIFAIILRQSNRLETKVINKSITATNWSQMSSATSPYVFKTGDIAELKFITNFLEKNTFTMFLRKVDSKFPDDILYEFINRPYEQNYGDYFHIDIMLVFMILCVLFCSYVVYIIVF